MSINRSLARRKSGVFKEFLEQQVELRRLRSAAKANGTLEGGDNEDPEDEVYSDS